MLCYIMLTMKWPDIASALRAHHEISGESYRSVARRAGVPARSLTSILQGHAPSIDRAAEICVAIGLEFYIGPPRRPETQEDKVKQPLASGGRGDATGPAADPEFVTVLTALADEYNAINDRGRRSLVARFWGLFPDLRAGTPSRTGQRLGRLWADELLERGRRQPFGARPVEILAYAAAAGGGASADSEQQAGVVWFRRDWLQRLGLDPTHCAVLSVRGESMEPTLPEGSSILINRQRAQRRHGQIFVLRTAEGLVVKRTVKHKDGAWELASDHPAWSPVPFPNDATILGRVVWTARALV